MNLRGQPHDDTARARWAQIDHVLAFGMFIRRGKKTTKKQPRHSRHVRICLKRQLTIGWRKLQSAHRGGERGYVARFSRACIRTRKIFITPRDGPGGVQTVGLTICLQRQWLRHIFKRAWTTPAATGKRARFAHRHWCCTLSI